MTDRRRPLVLLVLLTSVGCGCSEDDGAAPNPGGGGVASGGAAGSGGLVWSGGTSGAVASGGNGGSGNNGGCGSQPLPKEVPVGFQEYTGYSCGCRFYVPGPGAKALDPVEWEPCPEPGPIGVSCRRMKTSWTASSGAMRLHPKFWYDEATKEVVLQFARLRLVDSTNAVRHSVVAEADGVVRNAFVEVGLGCSLADRGVQGGKFLFGAVGDFNSGEVKGTEGFVGGAIGHLPDASYQQPLEQYNHTSWRMTSEWIIRWKSGLFGRRFDSPGAEVTIFDPSKDVEGLPPYNVQGVGPTVLFRVGSGVASGVMAWTEKTGAQPLIRYPGDYTRAAANFGTDGSDLVWTHGEGTFTTATGKFSTQSVMTAPFSTDQATVETTARRLRSDPGPLIPTGFAVGVGYAARQVDTWVGGADKITKDLLVVRLADGVSWLVKMPSILKGAGFDEPLGFSNDEVFSTAQFPDDSTTIVRIRLDSLGPGTPPD